MAYVRIDVHSHGVFVKTVTRRLRHVENIPHIRFRGTLYPVFDGSEIEIGDVTASSESDAQQEAVVRADASARLVVNAGPGMGKTWVACKRIAHLIEQGVEPSNIWVVSFTRTAVSELRDRIAEMVSAENRAAAVNVTTLDSHAWYFRKGFETADTESVGSYEEGIVRAMEVLRADDGMVDEYLGSLQHILVDEAQDLVGPRAEFVHLMISKIPSSCGVTVFSDDAQAIYGFSLSEESVANRPESPMSLTLPERLRSDASRHFDQLDLKTIHRTNSKRLARLYRDARRLVLTLEPSPAKVKALVAEIEACADDILDEGYRPEQGDQDDLVLFRRRAEVHAYSAELSRHGVAHRLRLPGFGRGIVPWVALVLWDHHDRLLHRALFERLWADRVGSAGSAWHTVDTAWDALWRAAGTSGNGVDIRRLRAVLSRSAPPLPFLYPDVGSTGPIVGTIHASKGREAARVNLMISAQPREDGDLDEEARVLFVGATRAKRTLRVGRPPWVRVVECTSGRIFQPFSDSNKVRVEVGRDGDLDEVALVSDQLYPTENDVEESQAQLRLLVGKTFELVATQDAAHDYVYKLVYDSDGRSLVMGALSSAFKQEMWKVAKGCRNTGPFKPPKRLPYLRAVGVRSVVIAENDTNLNRVRAPYDNTGVFLAPTLCSFATTFLGR